MEVRLLGPVGLWHAGGEMAMPRAHRRCVLAALALAPRQPVPPDALVDRVWGDQPPRDALHSLYSHVSALRRLLQTAGDGDAELRRVNGGYVLDIDPDRVDLYRSRRLADAARSLTGGGPERDRRALALLRESCSLWRGAPLTGLNSDWAARVAAGLEQERLTLLAERFEAELRLGGHAAVIGPLSELLADYPMAEPLVGLQMLALYRCGRQADALALYARTRRRLVDELGDEPGAELRRLHERILRRDQALDLPDGGVPALTAAAAGTGAGATPGAAQGTDAGTGTDDGPVPGHAPPAQLPPDVATFTGRERELAQLDRALLEAGGPGGRRAAMPILVLTGAAGVGKTTLAVHWAHRVAGRFPDGQLFVNLRGYAEAPPLRPVEALAALLRSLGVAPEQVPVEVEEASGRLRSLLAGRRVLIVLDDAHSAAQVRPLLPGSPGCLVVVTSRDRLTGLVARQGARRLTLDVLAPGEAYDLLTRLIGPDRASAEPKAIAELAGVCAYLPLALCIAAATLTDHPQRTAAAHVAELTRGNRLTKLAVEGDQDSAVRAAFDQSYQAIPAPARRLFRLLGLVPGPDVSVGAAAALTGTDPGEAQGLLDRLAGAHLVDQRAPGRYALHDLLRLYARERAELEDSEAERTLATGRLLGWYLRAADAAARLLYPEVLRLPLPAGLGPVPVGFDEPAGARAWLEDELPNLTAAVRHAAGPPVWLLADALRGYLWLRRHTVDWLIIGNAALAAATAAGDQRARAAARLSLGDLHLAMSRYPQAIKHYTAALDLAGKAGWTAGQAAALGNLGMVRMELGQLQRAADHLARALAIHRRAGRVGGQAALLAKLGVTYRELGRLDQAAEHLAQASALYRRLGARVGEAHTLGNLGEIDHDLGRLDQAERHLTRGLALYREVGDRYGEANTLAALAAVRCDAGRHDDALEQAEASVTLADALDDHRTKADALNTLGSIELRLGRAGQALERHQQALDLARHIGARVQETHALLGLARAATDLGRGDEATGRARQALAIAERAGYRLLEGHARTILAAARLALGQHDQAAELARGALAVHRDTGHRLGQARALLVLGDALKRGAGGEPVMACRREVTACWREALALLSSAGDPDAERVRALLDTAT